MSSMEEKYKTSSNFYQYINIVESAFPCAPPTIQCRDDFETHEFDRSMEKFSIVLYQDLIMDRLISKVGVKRTRSGFATYTDRRHHWISADLLAIKWVIVLDKAKRAFQSTTQDNVISCLKPLTWRYTIDFL